ncbi:MAG: hypothetical protein A3Q59_06925 [Methanomethylophilus alvi]|nr:MAG: hypothetical protein A3Q59_06925 [Methanomethylophilus alvi]
MTPDTGSTVYAVAFRGRRFLMVFNARRGGWEMPGGHIKEGETPEQAAVRETREESGFAIKVVATRDLGHCYVCAAVADAGAADGDCEMESSFFGSLPEKLSFPREEYLDTVPWAERELDACGASDRPYRSH